jgi:fructokinase
MAVVCAGELLTDRWPDGAEWPGGAPANVAFHAAGLGAESVLLSRIGDDAVGRRLRAWLANAGVCMNCCQIDQQRPTGSVAVDPSLPDGPRYDIVAPAAWDFFEAAHEAVEGAKRARVFVFGTLAQRHPVSRAAIRELVPAAADGGAWVLADLNLRAPFFDEEIVLWTLRHCGVLKLGREELRQVSALLGAAGTDESLFDGLLRDFGIPRGVLTAGGDGAWIHEDGAVTHVPALAVEAVDAVGAGDAFCAALAVGLDRGKTLRAAAPLAARVAGYVVTQRGATPPLPRGVAG